MRTTVDLPDDLFRRAKARAALQGMSFKNLVADGLKLLLQNPKGSRFVSPSGRVRFPLIKAKKGSPVITAEMVKAAEDRLIDEEAADYARVIRR